MVERVQGAVEQKGIIPFKIAGNRGLGYGSKRGYRFLISIVGVEQ